MGDCGQETDLNLAHSSAWNLASLEAASSSACCRSVSRGAATLACPDQELRARSRFSVFALCVARGGRRFSVSESTPEEEL